MKRAVLNYWVDMITGVAFLFCAATGIVRLFPEATTLTASGSPVIFGISTALWATIHDWSGAIMAAGVGVHTALHLRWLAHMTRKMAGGSRRERVTPKRPAPARVVAAEAQRPAPAAGVAPAVGAAAPPQVVAATSLERLEHMGEDRLPSQPSRMSRKAFLAGTAVLGGVALLGGLSIAGRTSGTAAAGDSTGSSSGTGNGYGHGTQSDSSASASGSTAESGSSTGSTADTGSSPATTPSARVVVDSGSCTGCGACPQVCPHGVFSFDGSKAVAHDPDACTLCGRCVQVCQTSAIKLNG